MKRVLTGLVIGAVLVVVFLLRELSLYVFDVFMGVVTVVCAMELGKLLLKSNRDCSVFAITLFPAFVYLWLLIGISTKQSLLTLLLGFMICIIVASLVVFIVYMCQKVKTEARMQVAEYSGSKAKFCLRSTINTAFGLIYPTFFLLLALIFNHIDAFSQELTNVSLFTEHNVRLGLIILIAWFGTTMASDVFAYYVGSLFKGQKLCPKISPNKTISGSIGGFIGSILFAVLAYIILCSNYAIADAFDVIGINYFTVIVFGFVSSLVTQFGDLFESSLKRSAGVKDSGNMLPGHGGMLDRCDGLCFNTLWVLIFFILVL